jgi:hypothetical protein
LCIAYLLLVVAITAATQESLFLILLVFLFNVIVIFKIGQFAIRGLVFPFSVSTLQSSMNNNYCTKYGYDFAGLLGKVYVMMRIQTGEHLRDVIRSEGMYVYKSKCQGLNKIRNTKEFESYKEHNSFQAANSKMRMLFELVESYSQTN